MAAAKAAVNKAEVEELLNRADRELLDSWTEPSVTRARGALLGATETAADGSESHLDPASLTAADLAGQLQKSVEVMTTVASYKKGYKGTSQKVLREAAHVVKAVGAELLGRTQDDESRHLRAANAQLSSEVEKLRRQLEELKRKVADMAGSKESVPPPCPAMDPPLMEVSSPRCRSARDRVRTRTTRQAPPLPHPPFNLEGKRRRVGNGGALKRPRRKRRIREQKHSSTPLRIALPHSSTRDSRQLRSDCSRIRSSLLYRPRRRWRGLLKRNHTLKQPLQPPRRRPEAEGVRGLSPNPPPRPATPNPGKRGVGR